MGKIVFLSARGAVGKILCLEAPVWAGFFFLTRRYWQKLFFDAQPWTILLFLTRRCGQNSFSWRAAVGKIVFLPARAAVGKIL